MKSILVIGGGVIGAASALQLQDAGIATTLIDRGDKRRGASYGNAGHIGSEQVSPWAAWENVWRAPRSSFAVGGPLDFRWRDFGLWAPWALKFLGACDRSMFDRGRAALTALLADSLPAWHRIAALADKPEMVIPHGHATVWTSARGAALGRASMEGATWGAASYRDLTATELARYGKVMTNPPAAGVIFSGTGQVSDPQGVREAVLAALTARGGEIVAACADRIETNDRGAIAHCAGKALNADAMLIAAGPWSRGLMEQLGVAAPLIAERGYHVQSAKTDWPFDLPTTVFEENFVVLTRFTSGLRATSFLEFGSPDAPGDARKWELLQRRIGDLGVKFSANPDRWVGSRPTLPDYVPAIGRLERNSRVLYAFGHQHLGLTMAPVTAEIVRAVATETAAPIDMAPFRIERFQ